MRNKKMFFGIFLVAFFFLGAGDAFAGRFTEVFLRYDRMKENTSTSLQIMVVPGTAGTEDKIRIVFGSATVGTGQSVTVTNIPSDAVALPGTLTAVGAGTSILVSGVTDLTVGTTYAFNLSVGVTTGAAGAASDSITSITSGGTTIDTTSVTSRYISDDQIVITANVPPTFTFVLSGNTDAFTTDLSSGSVSSTNGRSIVVTTNAAKGWTAWLRSTNAALTSVTTGESIGTTGTVNATPDTCVNGTDCYVLDVGITGNGTVDAEYDGNGTTSGGTLSTTFQRIAYNNAKDVGTTVMVWAHATMIATKAAGSDYTDTWTVVGAGNF